MPKTTATPTTALDSVEPPAGYPLQDWAPDGDPFSVEPEARVHYAAASASIDAWASLKPQMYPTDQQHEQTDSTPPPVLQPYTEWAHLVRLRQARKLVAAWRREAERLANLPNCPVCGEQTDQWTRLRNGFAADQPLVVAGLQVCTSCAALVEHELRAGDHLGDGRRREDAVRAFVEAWTRRDGEGVAG